MIFKEKMQYKTKNFGLIPDGTIISCHVLAQSGNLYLVYFPKNTKYKENNKNYIDKGCPSIGICKLNKGVLENVNDDSYFNLEEISGEFEKFLKKYK